METDPEYAERYRDQKNAQRRRSYERNKAARRAYNRAYYAKHKHSLIRARRQRAMDPEGFRKRSRAAVARFHERHPEAAKLQLDAIRTQRLLDCQTWDGALEWRLKDARLRARKDGTRFNITADDLAPQVWLAEQTEQCPVCHGPMLPWSENKGEVASLDRVVTRLGYVRGNVALVCMRCNAGKGGSPVRDCPAYAEALPNIVQAM
jgi:hypothetical protein